jgi:hypothetical protein
MPTETINIKNRWNGEVIFSTAISVTPGMTPAIKLGMAVKIALHECANLADANLADANLVGANLARANLAGANLPDANLAGANLPDANLAGADLADANLVGANLVGANLVGADLMDANLADANLVGANLVGANLADANLARANLARANLARANLAGAYLADAYLADAYLARAKNIKLPAFQIPQEGELIVYKKLHNGAVCKLRIPPESRRTASVVGRKCRAEFAEVIEGEGKSWRTDGDHVIDYAPGTVVNADKYDDNPLVECAGGIHFFLTREEAEVW